MTSDPKTAQANSSKPDPATATANNATGIFATPGEVRSANDDLPFADARPFASENAALTPPAPPVVHHLVFRENSAAPLGSDPTLNPLRSSAPARSDAPGSSVPKQGVPEEGGAFTQLFQTLNSGQPATPIKPTSEAPKPFDSAAAAAAAAPAPAPATPAARATEPSEGFTQMLRTLETSAPAFRQPEASTIAEEPARPLQKPGSQQVTSFDRAALQAFAPKPEPLATPSPAKQLDLGKPPVPASDPGSFTQLFQSLEPAATVPTVQPNPSASPNNFTHSADTFAATSGTPSEPSFTQLFRAPDFPAPAASGDSLSRDPFPLPAPQPTSPFRASTQPLQAEQLQRAPEAMPRSVPSEQPGSFTQLFQSEPQSPEPFTQRPATPSAFTQLLGALEMPPIQPQPRAQTSPTPPFPAPVRFNQPAPGQRDAQVKAFQSSPPAEPGPGVSQVFSSFGQTTPKAPVDFFSREPLSPQKSEPLSPKAPAGGLTQLLRTLDGAATEPPPATAPAAPAAAFAPTNAPTAGSVSAPHGNLGAPSPLARTETAGPSEFTQILQASMLREAALRGDGSPAAQASAPAERAPIALPPLPTVRAPLPVAVPAVPEVKAPAAPTDHKPMQKYLPLLLILIILLLVAILIAVVVLMKR